MKKIILGLLMVGSAYFVLFVPKTYELIENYISFSEMVGIGYLAIGMGIIGLGLIFNGLSN